MADDLREALVRIEGEVMALSTITTALFTLLVPDGQADDLMDHFLVVLEKAQATARSPEAVEYARRQLEALRPGRGAPVLSSPDGGRGASD